jgi:hypothetical protein
MSNTPHSLEITIDADGKLTCEVKGVKGKECTNITAWLDELGEVTEDRHTQDYFKSPDQRLNVHR